MKSIPYKVNYRSWANWVRTEFMVAEAEIPGLMALREEFGASKPMARALIAVCLHMTIHARTLFILTI